MTKRKPVLVLFIITAIVLIAGAVLFAIPTLFVKGTELEVTFIDLNSGIINALTGKNMVTNIVSVAVSVVLFILIPLIVHIKRKQHSVTVLLLIGALVMLYVELLILSYTDIKAPLIEKITKDQAALQQLISQGLLFLIGVGLIALSGILELITFIVDMVIRVKKEPEVVPTAQEMREEKAEEEPVQEEAKEEPAQVVAAPVEEPQQEEAAIAEPVEEEEVEMEAEPEEEVEEEAAEEQEEEEKPAPKKAPAKKAPAKKEAKKAPAKKEEAKKPTRETTTIKKPASRETTTIKKPTRETQTVKKAEVLTNEEGKQFVKAYHVSQRKELNKWQVKGAGSEKAIKLFDTQKEAIEYANQLSANNGAAVRVHSRAGKMRKA